MSLKDNILESIHQLIYQNIWCSDSKSPKWGPIAANGYEKRIIGFRPEIETKALFRDRFSLLDGGFMLSNISKSRCLDSSVYFTISRDGPDKYVELYSLLESLGFIKLFFIQYDFPKEQTEWSSVDLYSTGRPILFPAYTCYEFSGSQFENVSEGNYQLTPLLRMYRFKNGTPYRASYSLNHKPGEFIQKMLGEYPVEYLTDILARRFIFDGLMGFQAVRGIPSDIDMILKNDEGYIFIEIKEKDKSKTPPVGFGMDIPRMQDILKIKNTSGVNYCYVVREVNNQRDREFLGWHQIEMGDFSEATKSSRVIQGGTGMATAKTRQHPTLVAPFEKFKEIEAIA